MVVAVRLACVLPFGYSRHSDLVLVIATVA